jgi:hypothetical protein
MNLNVTLTISGSVEAMMAVLQSLPDVPITLSGGELAGNAPSTSTGTGTPVAPVSPPSPPNMAASIPAVPSPTMTGHATGSPNNPFTAGTSESVGTVPAAIQPGSEDDDDGPAADGTPDRDSNGLPWDERIHSAGKNRLNADGTWRKRRGVDDATVAAVEAELRAAQSVPQQPIALPPTIPAVPQPAPVAAPMPQPGPAPAPAALQDAVNASMGMPPQPAPIPAPAPAPVQQTWTPGSLDFTGLMQHLGPKFQERDANGQPLLHADYLAQITGEISTAFQLPQPLNAFTDIQSDQRMVDYAVQLFMRDGKW